jgi:diacylglycerol kinase (CTP)
VSATIEAVPSTPRELADQLHAVLVDMDPALWTSDAVDSCRAALVQIHAGASAIAASWADPPPPGTPQQRVHAAITDLEAAIPDPRSLGTSPADWNAAYAAIWPRYEALATALRADGERVAHVHPENWLRSGGHALAGLGLVLAFEEVFTPRTALMAALAWVIWAWSTELARHSWPWFNGWVMWFFGPVARHHERYRPNSATWLGSGILVLTLTVPDHAGALGLLAIGIGDPVAGVVGRRWGRTKGLHGRSIEGSVGFAAATFACAVPYLLVFHAALGTGHIVALALVAAVVGAVVEHLSTVIDDNLAVPVLTGWAVALVQAYVLS